MNLTNYHSHCNFCDGHAPLEEYVKSALAAGFTAYGVSSHAPLPFETCWTMDPENVPAYFKEIERLKQKYAGQIELYAGMEIDYLNEDSNPSNDYFQHLPLDYRIGSVHLVYTDDGEIVDTDTSAENFKKLVQTCFMGDLREVVRRYYESSMKMVEGGRFDFVGHLDKISYNANDCQAGIIDSSWYGRWRGELLDLVAEKGLMLEINTKAWQTKNCFFPMRKYWQEIRRRHIPVLVNSDVHWPELVNAGRMEALSCLRAEGFDSVRELHDGKWMDVAIDTD